MEKNLIETLHTLGPSGSNCENAAYQWFQENDLEGEVVLYNTLEQAIDEMPKNSHNALMGCVVYPKLHDIVFSNLDDLVLIDCLIVPTYDMVLAQRESIEVSRVASHPAPMQLIPKHAEFVYANSNPHAAMMCREGEVDSCITTLRSANDHSLVVAQNFGPVRMGFTVHGFNSSTKELATG